MQEDKDTESMEQRHEVSYHRLVIINRGIPGSGKSTLSKWMKQGLNSRGLSVSIHSTNDYFMCEGRYVYECAKQSYYHKLNEEAFRSDLEAGVDVVICDNTNLLPWQSQAYTIAARRFHYRVLFLNCLPREFEQHLVLQQVTEENPGAHCVPEEVMRRFLDDFHAHNDLLSRDAVRDCRRHHVRVWNSIEQKVMDMGEPSQCFDGDAVLTISPEHFEEYRTSLADRVWEVMTASDEAYRPQECCRHYLLTWYGITDIRSALGLEQGEGPIMGALRTGKYTDVIILGYTNRHKCQDAFTGAARAEWEMFRMLPLEERLKYPRPKGQTMVDLVSNTACGHELFQAYLRAAQLNVRIQFIAQEMERLNDARAISSAVRNALERTLAEEGEKDITLFLSPGTPLMAYTWATFSRIYPKLHLKVIASSDPRLPPEEIDLPKDVIVPEIAPSGQECPREFDEMIHLQGTDTNLPQYFSILQFPARRHWFLGSKDTGKVEPLRQLMPADVQVEVREVRPFDAASTRQVMSDIISSLPRSRRIGVHVTGGTKLMFAGALSACNEYTNTEPFYFDVKNHNITFLNTNRMVPFVGVRAIEGIIRACGYKISEPGCWQDNPNRERRRELTVRIAEKYSIFSGLFKNKEFRDYKIKLGKEPEPFNFFVPKLVVSYKDGYVTMSLDGEEFQYSDSMDFPFYLGGGWLEEYVYMQLQPLLESGDIVDLRIGVKAESAIRNHSSEMPLIELDGVFTDGKRLYVIECKSGEVSQNHIQKLANNVMQLGGQAARGILVHSCNLVDSHKERLRTMKNLYSLSLSHCNRDELMQLLS